MPCPDMDITNALPTRFQMDVDLLPLQHGNFNRCDGYARVCGFIHLFNFYIELREEKGI